MQTIPKCSLKPTRQSLTCAVFTLMLAVLLLYASPAVAAQVSFKDVGPEHPYYPFISNLSGRGLAAGFPDGTFRPGATITRAEFTVLLARAAGISGQELPSTPTFNDVKPEHWAYGDIEAAVQAGLASGYPGDVFKPGNPVSRAEAAALVLRLTKEPLLAVAMPGGFTDVGPHHWARSQIAAALDAGLFEPVSAGKFAPDTPASRAQAAKALAVMLSLMPEKVAVIGFDPADNAAYVSVDKTINITFSTDVQPGDSFDEIVLVGPGGVKVPANVNIEGGTLVIDPIDGLERDLPVDGIITLDFDLPLVERQTTIRLSGGGTTVNLAAAVNGTVLQAPYSGLEYSTAYTVTVPQGCVESLDQGTLNDEIEWIFITRP
ncbi:MAG TPA: hypothetical protein DEF34_04820 [Desulfotomaculum sp.]|nr:MAG: hypothetical protein JL56_03120 [Desulfotomaculum sp. BICA1-6]HBX22940.1 hypothetical protein [Desulfotomaculum sp.]